LASVGRGGAPGRSGGREYLVIGHGGPCNV
jgi:hypothetical protein